MATSAKGAKGIQSLRHEIIKGGKEYLLREFYPLREEARQLRPRRERYLSREDGLPGPLVQEKRARAPGRCLGMRAKTGFHN